MAPTSPKNEPREVAQDDVEKSHLLNTHKMHTNNSTNSGREKPQAQKKLRQVAADSDLPNASANFQREKRIPFVECDERDELPLSNWNWNALADFDPEVLVGMKCRVYWPADDEWYQGSIVSYDRSSMSHYIQYEDGDEEHLILSDEMIEFVLTLEEMQMLKSRRGKRKFRRPPLPPKKLDGSKGQGAYKMERCRSTIHKDSPDAENSNHCGNRASNAGTHGMLDEVMDPCSHQTQAPNNNRQREPVPSVPHVSACLNSDGRDSDLVFDARSLAIANVLPSIKGLLEDFESLRQRQVEFTHQESQLLATRRERDMISESLREKQVEFSRQESLLLTTCSEKDMLAKQLEQARKLIDDQNVAIATYKDGMSKHQIELQAIRESLETRLAEERAAFLRSPEVVEETRKKALRSFKMGVLSCVNEFKDVTSISQDVVDAVLSRLPPDVQTLKLQKDHDSYRFAGL